MQPFAIQALQDPTDGQIEQAVEICLSAYDKDENSVRALVGGDVSLLKEFFHATIRGAAGGRGAELHLATVGQEAIGMALWWGPGREPFSAIQQRQKMQECLSKLSPEAQEWHQATYRPGFSELTDRLLGPQGKIDSWYLNLLAVDPKYRRSGVAKALIDAVREKAKQ